MEEKIQILIADDHQMIRDGIKALLADVENFELVDEAANGEEVIEKVKNNYINLILMDISMPKIDGIETTKYLSNHYPQIKILGLTMHDEERNIVKMVEAGAMGYLLKNTGKKELVEAINTIFEGKNYFAMGVSNIMMNYFVKNSKNKENSKEASIIEELTEREIDILKQIANGYTNQEIAENLFISKRTVDTHRRNLLQKLQVKNTAGLVRYAVENEIIEKY